MYKNMKVLESTRKQLKLLAALQDSTMMDVVEQLVVEALLRLKEQERAAEEEVGNEHMISSEHVYGRCKTY